MTRELGPDTKAVLLAAGLLFLCALTLGIWKYRQMASFENHLAHPYVDTAHRAALLYSFATLLLAAFVELSAWSTALNLIAAGAILFFFVGAIASYVFHGWRQDTDNQFRDARNGTHQFMTTLILAEIGGFVTLIAGFVDAQIL